ncbi:MAG: SDR family oxidoreductase [Planctomycetales bacterium]|nr:SDR family oxidoreductase [Planctomycetales bacterium]
MRVLATGTDGYIGTILGNYLLQRGYDVVGLDTGFYRSGWLYPFQNAKHPQTIAKDIRDVTADDLRGFDAICHLAELSNDPIGELNPEITFKINHQGSVHLANICKEVGITRFVYTSSCSVYGAGADDWKDESSETNPQTAYAECKTLVERDVSALADENFSPTFLRNATAFGASPRMRFDIVLNNLSGLAWTTKEIKMNSDGTPWRPLVHIEDICQAIETMLSADRDKVHNEVFNVGSTEQNYRVKEIAEIVAEAFPGCELTFGNSDGDNRSYRVSFDKIANAFPKFKCRHNAAAGAAELRQVFERIQMPAETFLGRSFTRLKELKHLLSTSQLSDELFWNSNLAESK